LGKRKQTGTKESPEEISSDVEMKDAPDSDAESGEEGEIIDVVIQDAVSEPKPEKRKSKRRRKVRSIPETNSPPKKIMKHQHLDKHDAENVFPLLPPYSDCPGKTC
jgi:hypothetical protein